LENTSPNRSHTMKLPDGRQLGYLELGNPQGKPMMIIHGLPGSRLDGYYIPETMYSDLNLHAVIPDRPGIGLSDFRPGRSILDWSDDVAALADIFGWENFDVLGISAGGPSALACAYKMPQRVRSLTLAASVAPLDVPGITKNMGPGRYFFILARRFPWLVHLQFGLLKDGLKKTPDKVMQQVAPTLSPPDQAILKQDTARRAFQASLLEMMRRGTRGMVWDASLVARHWGFSLSSITIPVHIWYGGRDTNAPPQMGAYLSEHIPHSTVHYMPDEGHFSIIVHHFDEMTHALSGEKHV